MTSDPFELAPHGGMRHITKSRLWKSWKEIRKRLRYGQLRDIVDHIDYDVNPDTWITRVHHQINTGSYEPSRPTRFSIGKSRGFSRWMTFPEIPDLVLFHAICTMVVERAQKRRRKHSNVYFARDQIDKARRRIHDDSLSNGHIETLEYGRDSFLAWMMFNQYRKLLAFNRPYQYIVTTDISNFFDSIAHVQLEAALFELGLPRSLVGLLQVLLERLMFRDPYSSHPRVGIPVDEFDCSRCLAHLVLFAHDDRMVKLVGEDGYSRWMDDQVFGVSSEVEAYKLLDEVNKSLRRMHLSPNAAKSRIMKLRDTRIEYHFKANDDLDNLECRWKKNMNPSRKELVSARTEFRSAWSAATQFEAKGEWGKVLKRFYLAAGRLRLRIFVRRAHSDVLCDPSIAARVSGYLRTVCKPGEFITRALDIINDERIVYPDVNRVFADEILKMDILSLTINDRRELRDLGRRAVAQRTISHLPPEVGALLLLRFGDRRSARSLSKMLAASSRTPEARGVALVLASFGTKYADQILQVDMDSMGKGLFSAVRLVQRVRRDVIPKRVRARMRLRYDSLSGSWYLHSRTLLITLLYALNFQSKSVIGQIIQTHWVNKLGRHDILTLKKYSLL